MEKSSKKIALFPGTFDPITNGHLDVIKRAANLFDEIVIAIGHNPEKSNSLLPVSKRIEIISDVVKDIPNVRVESYTGLTVDFAKKIGSNVIIRGIRTQADLQYEYEVAMTNRTVGNIETVFILTAPTHAFTSSTLIKQLASMGGDFSELVPDQVAKALKELF